MRQFGKYQSYYIKIRNEVDAIKEKYGYQNLSKAFAHWFLARYRNLDDQQLAESIIDGYGDNGVDAILLENDSLQIFQFKFPDKEKNIGKCIDEVTVLKLINGYKRLTSGNKPARANELFLGFREIVKERSIFNYSLFFISFTDALSEPAKDALESSLTDIRDKTGNDLQIQIYERKRICDFYDRIHKRNNIDITLKYGRLDPSYNLLDQSNSWSGFANACDILQSCEDSIEVIFDENIRLYEGDNSVNEGIKRTAIGDDSEYFYFYHNGIVFICDSCNNSTGNQIASMKSASIVNGCQTIVTLNNVKKEQKLKDNVFLPIRIIETSDFDLRAKITEYLNSQTKIKDSYFLANNSFIRELQMELLSEGYFLERLANEYDYKKSLGVISEYSKDRILNLEKTIQVYVAYYDNGLAATAKREKNNLFDKEQSEKIISNITKDKVIISQTMYYNIQKIISMYRRSKRSSTINTEFLEYLGIVVGSNDEYENVMEEYAFMNTADFLLLNATSNLNNKLGEDMENIKTAIRLCKSVIDKDRKTVPSIATKSISVFDSVQKECLLQ